jgi:DNA uptake protein ComE-like DNA-binding protein
VGLKGIGPVYASRIIKYRQLLGGYATTSQILEVYGLPNETFLAVKDYLMVDPNDIDKFNLNVSTFERMLKHPYIGKYKAQLIEKLRKSLKGTINKNDLIENNIFSETEIERLLPYLMF